MVSIPLFSGLVTDAIEQNIPPFNDLSQSLCFQGWLLTRASNVMPLLYGSQSLCFQGWLLTYVIRYHIVIIRLNPFVFRAGY